MNDLLNFGFSPTGTALGSEGSPSMPMEQLTGLEDPMVATAQMLDNFSQQTQRRYGDVSDPSGAMWDPRGMNALSSKPSDYKTTDLMRPDEIPMQLSGSDDQLMGGDPVLAPYIPDSTGFAEALYRQDIGLSPEGAATLADSLQVYDPKILEGIKLPGQVEPQVTNEIGLTGQYGGLPDAFFDPSTGVVKQGVPETVDRVVSQSAQYQHVDENGVVHKYAPGTSPYDVIGDGRMAGLGAMAPAKQPKPTKSKGGFFRPFGTSPAQTQASGGYARQKIQGGGGSSLSAAGGGSGGGSALGSASGGSSGDSSGGGLASATSVASTGTPTPVANAAINQAVGSGGSAYYGIESVDGGVAAPASSKPWWLLLLIPVAGGAIYLATRKKGKRGKR